jgi:hypothetical protein
MCYKLSKVFSGRQPREGIYKIVMIELRVGLRNVGLYAWEKFIEFCRRENFKTYTC